MLALFIAINLLSTSLAFTGIPAQSACTRQPIITPSACQLASKINTISNDDTDTDDVTTPPNHRRSFLQTTTTTTLSTLLFLTQSSTPAHAGIDPSALKALPIEGDTTGIQSRLKQIESLNGPRPEDSKDIAFKVLPSGASYREYREGKGEAMVQPWSKVGVEMTIRCRSFATANEPGGLKYFSTKEDTEFNELAWTVGEEGTSPVPPELEEAMMGMRKGAVRRIELPSTAVFAARKAGRLPVPSEKNKDGKRLFEKLFKTDATLLFEVLVTRIK